MKPVALFATFLTFFAFIAVAQPPEEMERLVDRIALYPDPLLGNILAASTYSDQVIDADEWAHRHSYLRGDALAHAIADDRLWFDPSVQALLPFPEVLDRMARDIEWTRRLGDAFLANRPAVMDAVQRLRHRAWDYGYLRCTREILVRNGPYIDIVPVDPGFYHVPYYDPAIVYFPPRPGFRVALGIRFGPGITLGAAFAPWGWVGGGVRFGWDTHAFILNNRPWEGVRRGYVHPYNLPHYEPRGPDRREMHERREGRDARRGRR